MLYLLELRTACNKLIFSNKATSATDVIEVAKSILSSVTSSSLNRLSRFVASHADKRWIPPHLGSLKLNTDTSFTSSGGMGFGAVIRDFNGTVLVFLSGYLMGALSTCQAELMALREGLELAKTKGLLGRLWSAMLQR